ncbi:hypothetical protein BaRGS_00000064, partial [Batillaria attramentaria]
YYRDTKLRHRERGLLRRKGAWPQHNVGGAGGWKGTVNRNSAQEGLGGPPPYCQPPDAALTPDSSRGNHRRLGQKTRPACVWTLIRSEGVVGLGVAAGNVLGHLNAEHDKEHLGASAWSESPNRKRRKTSANLLEFAASPSPPPLRPLVDVENVRERRRSTSQRRPTSGAAPNSARARRR